MHLKLQIGVWAILVWYSSSLSTHISTTGTTDTTAGNPTDRPKSIDKGHNTNGETTEGQANTSKTTAYPTDTTQSSKDTSTGGQNADTTINPTIFSSRVLQNHWKTSTTLYPNSISASKSDADENEYTTRNPLKNSASTPLNDEKGSLTDGDENENEDTTRNPMENVASTPLNDEKGNLIDGDENEDTTRNPLKNSPSTPLNDEKGNPTDGDEKEDTTINSLKNSASSPLNDEKRNPTDGDENEDTTRNLAENADNTPLNDEKGNPTDGDENEHTTRNPLKNSPSTPLNDEKGNPIDGDVNKDTTRNPMENAANTPLNDEKGNLANGDVNKDTTRNPLKKSASSPLNDEKRNPIDEDENEDTTRNLAENAPNIPFHDENRTLTETDAGISSSMSDAEDWMNLLSTLSNLCPGIDVCGKNESLKGNTTVTSNVCCIECSCEISCFKNHNCCFDNKEVEDMPSTFDCRLPVEGAYDKDSYGELTSYRFIKVPPKNGCVTNLESSKNYFAPWGDFNPVYSKSLNLNFKNEYLAKCHGAQDIQEWSFAVTYAGIDYEGAHALTAFYRTFQLNKTKTFLVFEPPNDDSRSSVHACYHVTSSCPKDREDTFYVPSNVGMDRHTIIQACNTGPRVLYFSRPSFAFKNVFCALCNSFSSLPLDSLRCHYQDSTDPKTTVPTFKSILVGKNIEAEVSGNEHSAGCYRQAQSQNEPEQCTQLQCPMLQVRTTDGRCLNPVPVMQINCLYISLNLTTAQAIANSFLTNISQTKLQLVPLFSAASPWGQSLWEIIKIAFRMEINNTEFLLVQRFKGTKIDFNVLIPYVQNQLRKKWVVQFDKELQFEQSFSVHGNILYGFKSSRIVLPEWDTFTSIKRPKAPPPKWDLLHNAVKLNRIFCMHVNKLFLCEQVQLKNNEFEVLSQDSALYLNRSQRFLYPDEFSLFVAQPGQQTVHVCLKDSDYIKVPSIGVLAYMHPGAMFLVGWLIAEFWLNVC